MSSAESTPTPTSDDTTVLTRARDAAVGVAGVASMHAGAFGEVATYLPGDRIQGLRRKDDRIEVHVAAEFGQPLAALVEKVRETVRPIVGCPVDVFIEDVVEASKSSE